MSLPIDPLQFARRLLSQAENMLVDRAIHGLTSLTVGAVASGMHAIERRAADTMTMLARLPHALANRIADLDRGPGARPLTAGEIRLATEAHGWRTSPHAVRIVRGPGRSDIAAIAFWKGNPAITIGNTIYIKADHDVNHADLSTTPKGAELMVHEFTHVVQYATLGFTGFGARYAAELARHHGNPDELYDYKHRKLDYRHETLEGQAEMAGNFGRHRHSATPQGRAVAAAAGAKLRGTGVYGQ